MMDFGTLLASSGVDYSVSGKVKDTTFGITLLIKSGWMKIRVSYLLSGRPEIYLGSFIAGM